MLREFRNLYIGTIALLIMVVIGVSGYVTLEGYSFTDALYMTIITISTVGFGEIRPFSAAGRIFTIILIVSSLGLFGYIITSITRVFFDGDYKKIIKKYNVNKKMNRFKEHVIVCGFGRNGRQASLDLLREGKKVVVIERSISVFDEDINEAILKNPDFLYIIGDASHEETLFKTMPQKASALVTSLPNDAENLLIILTVREICPSLTIISRASDEHSYTKLKRAGANNVIMPDIVGGSRMAKLVVQPDIVEFLEMIMLREGVDVQLEEIFCSNLNLCDEEITIADLDIRKKTGVSMLGVKTITGNYIFNPSADMKLKKEDKLFVMGKPEQIVNLKEIMNNNKSEDE